MDWLSPWDTLFFCPESSLRAYVSFPMAYDIFFFYSILRGVCPCSVDQAGFRFVCPSARFPGVHHHTSATLRTLSFCYF